MYRGKHQLSLFFFIERNIIDGADESRVEVAITNLLPSRV